MSLPYRRTIRLRDFDYASNNSYFVTICTQNRDCLFGQIKNGEMGLNAVGNMIQTVWDEIPQFYDGVEIGTFQTMPNHIHGIVHLTGEKMSLFDVVHRFKSLSTHKYKNGVNEFNWPAFDRRVWQRNYYEHIIRNEEEHHRICEYILANPLQWDTDQENPNHHVRT